MREELLLTHWKFCFGFFAFLQVREILDIPDIKHKPCVLQNESHPYLQERDLRDFCRINGIVFQVQ